MRHHSLLTRALCVALAFAGHCSSMAQQAEPSTDRVLYMTKLALDQPAEKRTAPSEKFNFYCTGDDFAAAEKIPPIEQLVSNPPPVVPRCRNDRLLAGKGTKVTVVYITSIDVRKLDLEKSGSKCPVDVKLQLDHQEVPRMTAIKEGFDAVIRFAVQKIGGGAAAPADVPQPDVRYCTLPISYQLQEERARLSLTATVGPSAPSPASAPARNAGDAANTPTKTADGNADVEPAKSEQASYALITGPIEHLFLSGDAVVRGVKELKYDQDKKGVFERDKPDQLYLGINYMVGDVYGRYDLLSADRLVGKLLISPSKRPFDSVGLGVGYRFMDLSDLLDSKGKTNGPQASGGFVLFVGHFWTKGDSADNDGGASNGKRTQSWRVGLSYSLDTLFGWLK